MTFFKSVTALTVKASLMACATFVAAPLGAGAAAAQDYATCVYSNNQKVCGPEFATDGTIFIKDYGDYQQLRNPIYRTTSQRGNIRFCLQNRTGTLKQINLGIPDVNTLTADPGRESCGSYSISKYPRLRMTMSDQGRSVAEHNFTTTPLGGQLVIFRWTR